MNEDMERIKQLSEKDQLELLWSMVLGMQKVIDAYGMVWALWEKKMHEFQVESVQEMQSLNRHRSEENSGQKM